MATTKKTTTTKKKTTTEETTPKVDVNQEKLVHELNTRINELAQLNAELVAQNKKHEKVVDDLNYSNSKMFRQIGQLEIERNDLIDKCQQLKATIDAYNNKSWFKRLFDTKITIA